MTTNPAMSRMEKDLSAIFPSFRWVARDVSRGKRSVCNIGIGWSKSLLQRVLS